MIDIEFMSKPLFAEEKDYTLFMRGELGSTNTIKHNYYKNNVYNIYGLIDEQRDVKHEPYVMKLSK